MSSDASPGTADKLVRMANQIASFFATQPGIDRTAETAAHITAFWDPRMRAQLADLMMQGGTGLSPLAHAAAERVQQDAA